MKINDALFGIVFVIVASAILITVQSFPTLPDQPYGPATFPTIIAIIMLLGGIALCISGYRERAHQPLIQIAAIMKTRDGLVRMASVPVFMVLYILLSKPVGFPIVVPVLLAAFLTITTRKWLLSVVIAVATTAALWLFFVDFLMVSLPLGILTKVIY
ncbi:tripartite tricarboxylate transporter TctB family protein [Thalassospira marina]|uniref:DUF1468 domain-containing protein n=1 Tax=Thalassospira marina TaxID=2048283 RepID=A0A2N3KU65_9PROT|nr:tripartite tricarboxylate transporter TctB family protein [Thalassospira marina]AUG54211.1 hypothetical protein CSC3H3_16900 [Thalassospira marina]PKR54129.1 hypothetical protein COO20_11335 [Thalassospira marina]